MDNVSSTPSIPTIGSSSSSTSWTSIVVPAFVAYTLLCSLLRLRRRDSLQKKFSYLDRASLSRMTDNDAQAIVAVLAELEFPKLYLTSLQFALFKVSLPFAIWAPSNRVKDLRNPYNFESSDGYKGVEHCRECL